MADAAKHRPNLLDGDPIIQALIKEDSEFRRMWDLIDLSFVRDWVAERCPACAELPPDDPELLTRLIILQLRDKTTDAEAIDSAQTNCGYRYFMNLPWGEPVPDPSALTRFRDCIGVDGYKELFGRIADQAHERGLAGKRRFKVNSYPVELDAQTTKVVAKLDQKVEGAIAALTGPSGPEPEAIDLNERLDAVRRDASYRLGAAWRERWLRTWVELGARAEWMVEHRDDPLAPKDKDLVFRLQRVAEKMRRGLKPGS
ncbi:MAG TPA: hypothetical protein DGT21_13505 [Armatimonadetes bacterium]|jgi:hypothetical protein|nr:hypothetical protein [Armatimonadota bacterium]